MDIVVILGVDSDGIFVDVVTKGIDPDVVVVVVLDAFIIIGFVVVVMVAVVGGVAVEGEVENAVVDVEIVVVVDVVGVVVDGVAGFCHEPEIRKDVSRLLRDKWATKSVVIRQGYLF